MPAPPDYAHVHTTQLHQLRTSLMLFEVASRPSESRHLTQLLPSAARHAAGAV